MAKIYLITSGKGGTGKSAMAVNIAAALADDDKKVLVVDLDLGYRNLDLMFGIEDRVVRQISDVMEGRCSFSDACNLIADSKGFLYFLSASQNLTWSVNCAQKIKELLLSASASFDYIILDGPTRIPDEMCELAQIADKILLVMTPDYCCLRNTDKEKSRLIRFGLRNLELVMNRYDPGLVAYGFLSAEEIAGLLSLNILGLIPEDLTFREQMGIGNPILYVNRLYDTSQAFLRIAKRIEGNQVALGIAEEDLSDYNAT